MIAAPAAAAVIAAPAAAATVIAEPAAAAAAWGVCLLLALLPRQQRPTRDRQIKRNR